MPQTLGLEDLPSPDPDPTENPDPLVRLLVGNWSTIYSNYTYFAAGQPPHPGKTLGIFQFDAMNRVKGTLLPNVLGKAAQISFDGSYSILREGETGIVRGAIQIGLPDVPAPPPPQIAKRLLVVLEYVLLEKNEINWVLVGSEDPERVVVAGGKMFRINNQLERSLPKRPRGPGASPLP